MDEIQVALYQVIKELDKAMDAAKEDFKADQWLCAENPYKIKNRDGSYVLLDALTAKANAVAALANYERSLNVSTA